MEDKENQTTTPETEVKTFDDILQNKEYQSEFDKRISKALETAKTKWQQEQDEKQSEADKLAKMKAEEKLQYELKKEQEKSADAVAELEAYKLKDETIKQANEKGIPVGLIDLIDFKGSTAEQVNAKLESVSNVFNTELQKALENKLKQDPPTEVKNGGANGIKEIPNIF